MSEISVNAISPRTTTQVNITGLNPPTYVGVELAQKPDVVLKAGSIMTGSLELSGNATRALVAVPKQQLDSAVATLNSTISAIGATKSLTTNGYQVLPGGFTMQWFSGTASDVIAGAGNTGNRYSLTFPIAFPTACLHCYATLQSSAGAPINMSISITAKSTTGISYQLEEWSSATNPITVSFLAIGY